MEFLASNKDGMATMGTRIDTTPETDREIFLKPLPIRGAHQPGEFCHHMPGACRAMEAQPESASRRRSLRKRQRGMPANGCAGAKPQSVHVVAQGAPPGGCALP